MAKRISTLVSPDNSMQVLSIQEMEDLHNASKSHLYELFRNCSLAVLNTGSNEDNTDALLNKYHDFSISIIQQEKGIKLELLNAPEIAFVNNEIIQGIKENLFSVLRDIIFINTEIISNRQNIIDSDSITNALFKILRHANILLPNKDPSLVICWGGHSINRDEYEYSKLVGYELGLRKLDICTGCGPGVMKGPMKGAALAHSKQRIKNGRYIGLSEPGIIAAESPNAMVNNLVILPDIEKRLEAFVRIGHSIIIFPGGVGTAEEIFYILAILLHPSNSSIYFPLIFTASKKSQNYFKSIDKFIKQTLGSDTCSRYQIIYDDPVDVADNIERSMQIVKTQRKDNKDSFSFNWNLKIPYELQKPFIPTHENMKNLNLSFNQTAYDMALNLRSLFSGIVAGNVKSNTIKEIQDNGPFEIKGDRDLIQAIDELLTMFINDGRMKVNKESYVPCYTI
jgi:predicted Rossmann-fold nucleotide-binding protein